MLPWQMQLRRREVGGAEGGRGDMVVVLDSMCVEEEEEFCKFLILKPTDLLFFSFF